MGLSRLIDAAKVLACSAIVWVNCGYAWAASENLNLNTEIDPVATPMPSMVSLLIKLVVSMVVVGGLAYLTIRFLKRNTQVTSRSETINVLDQFAMGMNKGLFIMEIAGKVLVLGVTDQNINVLYEITDPKLIEDLRTKAVDRENQPIIPPRFWEVILDKSKSLKKPEPTFSTHIQQQIKKLQLTADQARNEPTGKDEGNEHNGR